MVRLLLEVSAEAPFTVEWPDTERLDPGRIHGHGARFKTRSPVELALGGGGVVEIETLSDTNWSFESLGFDRWSTRGGRRHSHSAPRLASTRRRIVERGFRVESHRRPCRVAAARSLPLIAKVTAIVVSALSAMFLGHDPWSVRFVRLFVLLAFFFAFLVVTHRSRR